MRYLLDIQDEAFELGRQWAMFYEPDSISRKLISDMMDSAFLVNVVHNDFKDTEAIFKPFYAAGETYNEAHSSKTHNGGAPNGSS